MQATLQAARPRLELWTALCTNAQTHRFKMNPEPGFQSGPGGAVDAD